MARSQLQLLEPTSGEQISYLSLVADLEQACNHENVMTAIHKHILRAVLLEIIVTFSTGLIELLLY